MWIEAVKKRGYPSQQRDWQTHGNREQGRSFPYLTIWKTNLHHGHKVLWGTTRQENGIRIIRAVGQGTHEIIFKWQFENTSPVPPKKNLGFLFHTGTPADAA